MRSVIRALESRYCLPLVGVSICVLALCLRLYQFDQSLWLDELHTAWVVADGISPIPSRAAMGHTSSVYFLFPYLSTQLLGLNEFALRLPSLLAGVALVFLAARFTFQLTRSPGLSSLAALIVACEPNFVFYSQEARGYAVLQWIALWQLVVTFRLWVVDSRKGTRVTWIVLSILLILLHPTAALQIVAVGCAYWIGRATGQNWQQSVSDWWLDLAIILVGCLPVVPQLIGTARFRHRWSIFADSLSVSTLLLVPVLTTLAIAIAAWIAAGGVRQCFEPGRKRQQGLLILLGTSIAVPLGVCLVLTNLGIAPLGHLRYLIVALAPAAILSCWLLNLIQPAALRRVALSVLFVVWLIGYCFHWNYSTATNRYQDWRSAVALVKEAPGSGPIFIRSGFIESERVRTDESVVPLALCPVQSIYELERSRLIPLPISDAGELSYDELSRLRESGQGWFIVCGTEDSVEDFLAQLNNTMARAALAAHAQQTLFGDLSVIRLTGIR